MHVRELLQQAEDTIRLCLRSMSNGFVFVPEYEQDKIEGTLRTLAHQKKTPLEVGDDKSHFICVCPDCAKPKPEPRMSSDNAALVNPAYKWHRITPETSRGAKLLLINRGAGVLTHGPIGSWPTWFTHYSELPVFDEEDKA